MDKKYSLYVGATSRTLSGKLKNCCASLCNSWGTSGILEFIMYFVVENFARTLSCLCTENSTHRLSVLVSRLYTEFTFRFVETFSPTDSTAVPRNERTNISAVPRNEHISCQKQNDCSPTTSHGNNRMIESGNDPFHVQVQTLSVFMNQSVSLRRVPRIFRTEKLLD